MRPRDSVTQVSGRGWFRKRFSFGTFVILALLFSRVLEHRVMFGTPIQEPNVVSAEAGIDPLMLAAALANGGRKTDDEAVIQMSPTKRVVVNRIMDQVVRMPERQLRAIEYLLAGFNHEERPQRPLAVAPIVERRHLKLAYSKKINI